MNNGIAFLKNQPSQEPSLDWVAYDDFNDNSINASLWNYTGAGVTEQSEMMQGVGAYNTTQVYGNGNQFSHTVNESIRFRFVTAEPTYNNNIWISLLGDTADDFQITFYFSGFFMRVGGSWVQYSSSSSYGSFESLDLIITFTDSGFTVKPYIDGDLEGSYNISASDTGPYRMLFQTGSSGSIAYYLDEIDTTEGYL